MALRYWTAFPAARRYGAATPTGAALHADPATANARHPAGALRSRFGRLHRELWPGLLLCCAVALAGVAVQRIERGLFGEAWLEALVLAILIGTAVRSLWTPGPRFRAGISFGAKGLLETAIVLLGASVSLRAIAAAGPALMLGIAGVVVVSLGTSYGIGRLLGLPWRMAVLVAAGNSICGNSAIAAVAPVIGAGSRDVTASIAFTAVLGVAVVLLLPLAVPLLHMTGLQYGVLAGMTVYAVPQVLAATAPAGLLAVQTGTLVKLVRVLMLGPLVLALSLALARRGGQPARDEGRTRLPLGRFVPWFIVGFLLLAAVRSAGLLPEASLLPIATLSGLLTVVSMAALGLGVDVRVVMRAGVPVVATVTASLLVLAGISLGLVHLLGI